METLQERMLRWRTDLPLWAKDVASIRTKQGDVLPFRLNAAQRRLHALLEGQRQLMGQVWAVVLKGRQCGSSTYDVHRIAHACQMARDGVVALTLAQDDETAKKMARMVQLTQDAADPQHTIPMPRRSDHEKHWANGSYYEFRTATERSRRGGTPHRLHYTEMAYFSHPAEQMAGTLQQMASVDGSEAIFESTAKGPVGAWAELWREAQSPESRWQPIFLEWTLMPEYAAPVPGGFTLDSHPPNEWTPSEVEYMEQHGCTLEQMVWRRQKIRDLGATGEDGYVRFSWEYPITPEDAFLAASTTSFLNPRIVDAARKRNTYADQLVYRHPLVIGVDPAPGHGPSQTAVVWRRANIAQRIERRSLGFEESRAWLTQILEESRPAVMAIDWTEGHGRDLVESLQRTYAGAGVVVGVNWGGSSDRPDVYLNKKAEAWSIMRLWLQSGIASIPDEVPQRGRPSLAAELLSLEAIKDPGRLIQIEKKSLVIKRVGFSPDGAEALALTFAVPEPSPEMWGSPVHVPPVEMDVFDRDAGHGATIVPPIDIG